MAELSCKPVTLMFAFKETGDGGPSVIWFNFHRGGMMLM